MASRKGRPDPTQVRSRNQVYGVVTILAVVAAVALSIAQYQQVFQDRREVTIEAGRAGLLLEPGADVTLRNVTIGQVLEVERVGDGARITVGLSPEEAKRVPVDTSARIVSPSLLGPKYVDLVGAGSAISPLGIAEGAVIQAGATQVEVNVAFDNLVDLLEEIHPAQLNTTLGALAKTLNGRGEALGRYLSEANAYFDRFEPYLPALSTDVEVGAQVATIYADLAPALLRVLDSTAVTARTVVDREEALDALLSTLYDTSGRTRAFLIDNRLPLRDSLSLLRVTTGSLAEYAPMLPCLFRVLNDFRKSAEPATGGRYPGLWTHTSVLPGADRYHAPQNLPETVADSPTCSGGPVGIGHGRKKYLPVDYGDGSPDPYNPGLPVIGDGSSLFELIFGRSFLGGE